MIRGCSHGFNVPAQTKPSIPWGRKKYLVVRMRALGARSRDPAGRASPSAVHTSTALISSSHRCQQTVGRSGLLGILVSYFKMVQRDATCDSRPFELICIKFKPPTSRRQLSDPPALDVHVAFRFLDGFIHVSDRGTLHVIFVV